MSKDPATLVSGASASRRKPPRFPPTGMYAVMQIDAMAMIQHLQDHEALASARRIQTKKYLVYVRQVCNLDCSPTSVVKSTSQFRESPFPSRPWCRYSVSFIGNTLRPEEPTIGITSDMVVPIRPCFLEGRPQATPARPFPFPSCYHWIEAGADVRIRAKPGGYDEDHAVKSTIPEHMMIVRTFSDDYERMEMNEMAFKEATATVTDYPLADPPGPVSPSEDGGSESGDDPVDGASLSTCDSAFSDGPLPDIFGFLHDPIVDARMPLVNMWSDLENHISADTITDPREFEEEFQQVLS